ncbi:MAG: radical SAM protein [Fimbriimonadales bacterium]
MLMGDRDRYVVRGFSPAYLPLHQSGELERRAEAAREMLADCRTCPRACRVDRTEATGTCGIGRHAKVASYGPHHGEERCLRGTRGSGTVFFAGCNLRCVFCQNFEISHEEEGAEVSAERLARIFLAVQEYGCHNLNLVTPSHVVPHLLEALPIAVARGLRLPIVYNTSAYDSLESLRLLDGIVDIYMPDFKLWKEDAAQRYLTAPNYPEAAREAIREMHRQVGVLRFDEGGLAVRGVLVRHLVVPGRGEDTSSILRFLANEIAPDTYVNVMAQYRPAGLVSLRNFPEIYRRVSEEEYLEAVRLASTLGLRVD